MSMLSVCALAAQPTPAAVALQRSIDPLQRKLKLRPVMGWLRSPEISSMLCGPPDTIFQRLEGFLSVINIMSGLLLSAIGGSASYSEQVFRNLSARAAVAISMLDSDIAPDNFTTASALLGLRFDF